jgi:hypothetical protein
LLEEDDGVMLALNPVAVGVVVLTLVYVTEAKLTTCNTDPVGNVAFGMF